MSDLKAKLLTMCDFALVSREGKLSIVGMFDKIFVKQTPSSFVRMFIVAILEGRPGAKHEVEFNIQGPGGERVLPSKNLTFWLGSSGRGNLITEIVNLPLPKIGEYKITLEKNGKEIEHIVFWVSPEGEENGHKKTKLPN